jgi:hypothetical protein
MTYKIVLISIALLIMSAGVIVRIAGVNEVDNPDQSDVLSEKTDQHEEIITTTPTLTIDKQDSDENAVAAGSIKSQDPDLSDESNNRVDLKEYIYPGSEVLSEGESNLELTTSDSPQSVTDWYKNRINNFGMNVTSFVTTSVNGRVLNKLVGSSGKVEVRVEINKTPDSDTVFVIITSK